MNAFQKRRLPDFIIIGAMKAGTTSIHGILSHHDSIFMPDNELCFFDVDDIEQHNDFFIPAAGGWTFHDYERDFDAYLDWYAKAFEGARPDQLVGEDTTTYLASKKAPERIRKLLPDVRLIAVLRDPVTRAYSHYWHNVAAGRATLPFDRTIVHDNANYLARGFYKEHLLRYSWFLSAGRLKVVFFEDFIAEKRTVIDDLCDYLGIDGTIRLNAVDSHRNPARVPVFPPLRLVFNRFYRAFFAGLTFRNIPNMPGYDPSASIAGRRRKETTPAGRLLAAYARYFTRKTYPPMRAETRRFLQEVFARANRGLSELIGRDVRRRWSYMED